jgi:uncharacterized protein YjbI with pentapeptide repeats
VTLPKSAPELIERYGGGERDFSTVSLTGAILRGAALQGVTLSGARLRGANLHSADFSQASLGRADLGMADLAGANFAGADLAGADIRGANVKGASFVGALLESATLRGSDLQAANFQGAKMARADLSRAELKFADLTGAELRGADLQGADLQGANLERASLRMAVLHGADLRGANLQNADLRGAVLNDTRLDDANLSGATVGGTVFADCDLRKARGLDSLNYSAPSTIGTDTFTRSGGLLPEPFLIGCGLRPWEIRTARAYDIASSAEALRASLADVRAMEPARRPRVLVSFSQADAAFVADLRHRLTNLGLFSWIAPHESKGQVRDKQSKLIISHDVALLLVISERSVRSDWVDHEARLAKKLERASDAPVLYPLALDDSWRVLRESGRALDDTPEERVFPFPNWTEGADIGAGVLKLVASISELPPR